MTQRRRDSRTGEGRGLSRASKLPMGLRADRGASAWPCARSGVELAEGVPRGRRGRGRARALHGGVDARPLLLDQWPRASLAVLGAPSAPTARACAPCSDGAGATPPATAPKLRPSTWGRSRPSDRRWRRASQAALTALLAPAFRASRWCCAANPARLSGCAWTSPTPPPHGSWPSGPLAAQVGVAVPSAAIARLATPHLPSHLVQRRPAPPGKFSPSRTSLRAFSPFSSSSSPASALWRLLVVPHVLTCQVLQWRSIHVRHVWVCGRPARASVCA